MAQIKLSQSLLDAVINQSRRSGYSHTFYRYPAQFSNEFVKSAIEEFSKPGDIILDPFMGGGTTLVEAMALGRHAIGTDINPIAHLVSTTKTTLISKNDRDILIRWIEKLPNKLIIKQTYSNRHKIWQENGYQKNLPWHIRRIIELIIEELTKLPNQKLQRLARCALLRTGQWALDSKSKIPSVESFRKKYLEFLQQQIMGLETLKNAVDLTEVKPKILCLNVPASELSSNHWDKKINGKPSLVITSPPYPSVHVLYHRWQVMGRKETPAPYWIASTLDGKGESFYTMGGRSESGLDTYFENLKKSFLQISSLLKPQAFVVQLIAFSHIDSQLPRYLETMKIAGFDKCKIQYNNNILHDGMWRNVPSRKWHANYKGNIPSSKELLLIHQKPK